MALLHDPISDISLEEGDTRLEDYLNDKIQTRADLASLATLLENVELQKKQLEEQVSSHYYMFYFFLSVKTNILYS